MLTKRIIPCLDCKNGRVVKGVQFQNLVDAGSPSELAYQYQQDGADEIVLLDIGASLESRENQLDTVRRVRRVLSIPLTVGGGVRSVADVRLLLSAGADKVSVNTAAVFDPPLVARMANDFGSQCVVVAIDAKKKLSDGPIFNQWQVLTKSGTENHLLDVVGWAKQVASLGAGEVLLTSFDRDGTNAGYDLALVAEVSNEISIPIIASGGAQTALDLKKAFAAGADAVLAASMFHFRTITVNSVKKELKNLGTEVRL